MQLAGFVIRLLCFDIPLHPLGDDDVAVLIAISGAALVGLLRDRPLILQA